VPPDPAFEQYRAKLERERSELVAVIAGLADDLESAVIAVSLRENLLDVEGALAKLERGTYAVCESCERRIAHERLAERPAARLCGDCDG
jgi:RNA polymerase-binding transcription factor DksA